MSCCWILTATTPSSTRSLPTGPCGSCSAGPGTAEVQLLGGTPPRRVLEAAVNGTREVYRFALDTPSLQDIFVRTVGETPDPADANATA